MPPHFIDKLFKLRSELMDVRPNDTSGMTEADDTVHSTHVPATSIAARHKDALVEEANNAQTPDDPTSGRVRQDINVPGFYTAARPGGTITGTIDPVFGKSGFAIGDRIYHSGKKKEGTVKDLMASGGVIVKFDDGKKLQANAENLVVLPKKHKR